MASKDRLVFSGHFRKNFKKTTNDSALGPQE